MPNSIKKLEEAFKEGKYDQLLKDIYVDEAVIEYKTVLSAYHLQQYALLSAVVPLLLP